MWPFSEIKRLESTIRELTRENDRLKVSQISDTDKKELEFLRTAIKDYVVYSYESSVWYYGYRYFAKRTLKDSESDLTKARFYISVLEAQLGPDGTNSAHTVCERLKELCAMKSEVKELKEGTAKPINKIDA